MLSATPKSHLGRVREQVALLSAAVRADEPLADVLSRKGWSYEDLIYERARPLFGDFGHATSLSEIAPAGKQVPLVSFFTGCGGMDLGFEAAGFKHKAAFEFNELFCKTLRRNRPKWKVFGPPTHSGDVSKFNEISSALGCVVRTPFEGVFVGGPPCQPFSIASNQRFAKWGDNFKRVGFEHEKNGSLLHNYVDLILAFRPKAFVIENVPGLRDLDDGVQLNAAIRQLSLAGYTVEAPFVLDAARYGVPQQRQRLFVIGARGKGVFKHPLPCATASAGAVLLRNPPNASNHETREHKAESVLRYMKLDYGERDQLGRVDRLNPLLPSKTVIAGGTKGGGRSHLHPEIPRTLSVRECARLQTFPDDYEFVGSSARQFTQVGNAVPPLLAARIAQSVAESYF